MMAVITAGLLAACTPASSIEPSASATAGPAHSVALSFCDPVHFLDLHAPDGSAVNIGGNG